jgi:hypothetical protein
MFGFAAFAFLIVCAILAIATFLVFKSGAQGETKLGGCAGCAIAFALVLVAGLAAAMCAGVMVVNTQSELVRRGPVRSVELDFGEHGGDFDVAPAPDMESPADAGESREHGGDSVDAPADKRHAVHLKLVIRGDGYPTAISDWVRENTEGDVSVTMKTEGDRTVVDFGLPITREELRQFKRELESSIPGMKLPKGIKIEIKDDSDD